MLGSPPPSVSPDDPYVCHSESSVPDIFTEEELNDLVHDLELSKAKEELLESRLQQWNLLKESVWVTSFHACHEQFAPYFRKKGDFVFCYNVDGLMNVPGITHN
ncbi:Hypothetical predicted protein [Podarcis lilfordi]|uniref:Uncharacterized protein n=1 Tax=Podarcis lilfordi TaxID=74358 RepID=A0AA35PLS7_9SAUR|nr:Hypothetical predicted protein [Podarcis lilfordi]